MPKGRDFVLEFIVPLEKISLIWRRHHCRWRATNFDQCSALMAIEQWGFFSVPHLLIMVIFEDPWHSQLLPSVYLFLRLRSVTTGARTWSLACEANDLYQLNNHSDVFVCYFGVCCTFFSSSSARTILPMSSNLTTEAYSIFSYGKNHTLFSKEYINTILTKHWVFLKNYYPVSVQLIGTRYPFVKRILLCSNEGYHP